METMRLLTEKDAAAYYEVIHTGYAATKAYPISFAAADATEEDERRWLLAHPTYGLFDAGGLVSAITLRMPWGEKPGPRGVPHLGQVATREDRKGEGFSKKLFFMIERKILRESLRAPAVTLGTAAEHPWLCAMYESWGFAAYDTVQLPGKKHHTVYMEKILR